MGDIGKERKKITLEPIEEPRTVPAEPVTVPAEPVTVPAEPEKVGA